MMMMTNDADGDDPHHYADADDDDNDYNDDDNGKNFHEDYDDVNNNPRMTPTPTTIKNCKHDTHSAILLILILTTMLQCRSLNTKLSGP
jgi:hypothetical protein